MLSIILGLINVIPLGIANSMSRKPSQAIGGKNVLFYRQIVTSIGLTIVLLFNLKTAHFDLKYIVLTFIISIICYFAMLTLYKSIEVGKVGIVSPISSSYVIYSVILTTLFFKTPISGNQIISIAAIIIGALLINLNFRDIRSGKKSIIEGVIPAFWSSIFFGVFFFLIQFPNKVLGPFLTAPLIEIAMFACVAIDLNKKRKKVADSKITFNTIFWIGLLTVIATTAFYYGLSICNASIFLVISSSSPMVVILYGYFVFKEKLTLQQYAAVLLILAGICTIAIK